MQELVNVENRVAVARSYYIDAQTALRNRLQTFPDSWLALFAGAMPPEYASLGFESTADVQRATPQAPERPVSPISTPISTPEQRGVPSASFDDAVSS